VNVYFISGLAADRSIFKYIRLPEGHEAVHLDWILPVQNESLPAYAHRLAEKIDATKPFAIVGLSLGGMLAVEIAKKLHPEWIILISSIPSIRHLPVYLRAVGRLQLHRVIPVSLIQQASILKRFFTSETREDKKMLKVMIRKSDAQFIKWAMHAVLTWTNTDIPETLVHIHGSHDEILPKRFTKPTHTISNGRHLMVLNKADEINAILQEVFTKARPQSETGNINRPSSHVQHNMSI
jgi:surfactin synthase thioesterase subunit